MNLRPALFLALVFLGIAACNPTPSMGELINERGSPSDFVTEEQTIYITPGSSQGLAQVGLDGSRRIELFNENYSVADISSDHLTWVLRTSGTGLYLLREGENYPTPVQALDFDVGVTTISPDGQYVATTRPAIRSGPVEEHRSADDAIYIVDVDSLEVEIYEPTSTEITTWRRLRWRSDGEAIYYTIHPDERTFELDLETGERTERDEWDALLGEVAPVVALRGSTKCPHDGRRLQSGYGENPTIEIRSGSRTSDLVNIEGYQSARYSTAPLFPTYFFSESCDYVVFVYDESVWVVDVDSRVVGRVTSGTDAFPLTKED